MKRIFTTVLIALCMTGIAAAQDLEKATETYNAAAAAIDGNKAMAVSLFEQALDMAEKLGEEGNEIAQQCKGIIPKLYISLGKEFVSAKENTEAVARFRKAVELGEKFGDADVVEEAKGLIPQILMAEANQALNAKNYDAAIAGYQKVIDEDPANGAAHLRKGQALAAQNKVDEAIKAFELAAENGQEEVAAKQLSNIYVKKAVACQKAKDNKGMLENAQKSTQYVDNANAEKLIGLAAKELKQNKVAADAFEAYLSMTPGAVTKEPQIVYYLGDCLVKTGENEKACGYFKQIAQDAQLGEAARYQLTQLKCN